MLYIFHVDTGTMMTFDMNLALDSVTQLQTTIENSWRIPVEKQVLLVSGGESLDPNARVCSYSSGTDTNPIYLFSKSVIESTQPPTPSIDAAADFDMKDKVDASLNMPASYSTVVSRAQLAQEFCELAREQSKICEKLVHDQHLQQQGWAAVVANLEDITAEFKSRSDKFQISFTQYMDMRISYLDFLRNFSEDLSTLSKIPVLPALTTQRECDVLEGEQLPAAASSQQSLLQWISAADNQSSLDQVAEQCSRGLQQLDGSVIESLASDIRRALEAANNSQMKEVKGLGDRLYGLEQLMYKSKKYVNEQSILAQTFLQNQNRASNLGDPSILPDLCDSHRKQLALMLENHQNLRDIRRRCTRAKEELSTNLYHRLKWIMYVENLILETDHKLMIYHESLKRLRRHVEIVQQIHIAPAVYLNAVAEVVRRRSFSQAFLMWASELACHILTIHNDEVTRRKEFQTQFEGHFLNTLFPGMEDLPPSFATQAPSIFDSKLPKITADDVDRLKQELPDLTNSISTPDISAIVQFFLQKSQSKIEIDNRGVEEKLVQAVSDVGLASNLDKGLLKPVESETFLSAHIPHLKDLDKGCESETDTEEFEKVGQSPLELNFESKNTVTLSPKGGTSDAATLTEVGHISLPPRKPPRAFNKSQLTASLHSPHPLPRVCVESDSRLLRLEITKSLDSPHLDTFDTINESHSEEDLEELDVIESQVKSAAGAGDCDETDFSAKLLDLDSKSNNSISPLHPSKSLNPCSASPSSPSSGRAHQNLEFANDEYYIDESMPSSLSMEGTSTQSQGELARQLEQANTVVAIVQENLSSSKAESEKLKSLVMQMAALAREAIKNLSDELRELRQQVAAEREMIYCHSSGISDTWHRFVESSEISERETLQRLTVDHELEQSDLKKLIQGRNEEVQCLRAENQCLERSLIKFHEESRLQKDEYERLLRLTKSQHDELKKELAGFQAEKERAIKEAREELLKESKAEIDSIRTRYKLMSLMERSPSDSSLEKIDQNVIDLVSHNAIVTQLKLDLAADKQTAVSEATEREQKAWRARLEHELEQMKIRSEAEKQVFFNEAMRRVIDEKEKQIEILREREANLNLECIKYKNTIQQLTEHETESGQSLLERVEMLERDKCQLEADLSTERSRRLCDFSIDMGASVAVFEGKCDAATSPTKFREKLTTSQTNLIQAGKISIASCNVGDPVLVVWDNVYQNFIVLQESSILHFLNSDCLDALALKAPSEGSHRKLYSTAEVTDKEYCHARKAENRYRVPKGTKFYRIKVKALAHSRELLRAQHLCQHHHQQSATSSVESMSQSQSTEQSSSVVVSAASHSVPTSPTKLDNAERPDDN